MQGNPYVRRELEMPVAALHHAGISYRKLQEMEVALAADVRHEVANWGGRLLVHRELEHQGHLTRLQAGPPCTPPNLDEPSQ
eukprot:CAMPEP_0177779126 /NCGR_PEP_ID=MMETSP0491_2-20121128/16388_1 /TAXON_ID=63592 /ORGANISM="Tetraselmis chuii, Strain PLY429" /LENGTH=81 /DNA_ID=CAMNT_0019298579 /DNA_START=132 /DNA_END=377 /DNA_ORIENTATION=+